MTAVYPVVRDYSVPFGNDLPSGVKMSGSRQEFENARGRRDRHARLSGAGAATSTTQCSRSDCVARMRLGLGYR